MSDINGLRRLASLGPGLALSQGMTNTNNILTNVSFISNGVVTSAHGLDNMPTAEAMRYCRELCDDGIVAVDDWDIQGDHLVITVGEW